MKPGDRSVLHHVVSNYIPDRNNPPSIPAGSVGSYTPGAEPQVMADGSGAPVPAGGKLMFQMHYTTNGKATTDVVADVAPTWRFSGRWFNPGPFSQRRPRRH